MTDEPMTVPASPLPEQLFTAARQVIPVAAAYFAGRGWITEDAATMIVGLAGILAPIIWGQIKTLERSRKLAALADALPDDVAVTK